MAKTYYYIVPSQTKFAVWVRQNSPAIMTYGGMACMAGGTIAAAIGTKKFMEHRDEINGYDSLAKRVLARSKYYLPTALMTIGGAAAIHQGHYVMVQRNAALTAQIGTMAAAVAAYRKRVADEVGEKKEAALFRGDKLEEIVETDENGKEHKKKVNMADPDMSISNGFYFDSYCSHLANREGDMDLNEQILRSIQAQLNNLGWADPLHFVTLNTVYDYCKLYKENGKGQIVDYRTVAGQKCGWIFDKERPNGDNTIILQRTRIHRRLPDGRVIETLWIEPNVDGNILSAAKERGFLE